jgi:hypothetical protein
MKLREHDHPEEQEERLSHPAQEDEQLDRPCGPPFFE